MTQFEYDLSLYDVCTHSVLTFFRASGHTGAEGREACLDIRYTLLFPVHSVLSHHGHTPIVGNTTKS